VAGGAPKVHSIQKDKYGRCVAPVSNVAKRTSRHLATFGSASQSRQLCNFVSGVYRTLRADTN
jgi:hypothetical protein